MAKHLRRGKSLLSMVLSIILLTVWMIPSSILPVRAAVTQLAVKYRVAAVSGNHEIYWDASVQPKRIKYDWHNAAEEVVERIILIDPADPDLNSVYRYVTEDGKKRVVLTLPLSADHIFDINIKVYSGDDDISQTGEALAYVLTGISFEGSSFDQVANTLIEDFPILKDANGTVISPPALASTLISGQNPVMRLRWKVPTVYVRTLVGGIPIGIRYISETKNTEWKQVLQKNIASPMPILASGYDFSMDKGRNTSVAMQYNTYYDASGVLRVNGATVSNPPVVQGLNAAGVPTDGYIHVDLTKENGIESGTEFEDVNISLALTTTGGSRLLFNNTGIVTGDNIYPVVNTDSAFTEYGALTSIFTPMEYELAKVDEDKVEVRFRKVTNGVYTELYYEVQDLSGNELNNPNAASVRGNWVTVPDSSLPAGTLYGSVILSFAIVNGNLPERYIRVVCAEQGASIPRNTTMVNNLTLLGGQTGKPALPQNMTVEAKYDGIQTVSQGAVSVEIPMSKIVLTFDKPSVWSSFNGAAWTAYQADLSIARNADPVYNILLSSLLPDTDDGTIVEKIIELTDGTNTISVQSPVRQKRTVVIGKQQLSEVPGNPGRLTCEIDGTGLYMDFASDSDVALDAENNEIGTRGPYPTFLIPNMTYYLQVFSARFTNLAELNDYIWPLRNNPDPIGYPTTLKEAISFTSPVFSFTTYPIREVPVPVPNLTLSISPNITADPATGVLTLAGIDASYNHILQETDWKRYLSTEQWNLYDTNARNAAGTYPRVSLSVAYQFYISTNGSVFVDGGVETVTYPALSATPPVHRIRSVPDPGSDGLPAPGAELILPNSTYYIKARPSLLVTECPDDAAAPNEPLEIGNAMETAVKTITTPKLDLVSLDNITRNPRAPTEFSIASDGDGNQLLTDASVTMQWMHRESDVGYEMIVTSFVPDPAAEPTDQEIATDSQLVDFLAAYRLKSPDLVSGSAIYIPLNDAAQRVAMQSNVPNGLNLLFDTQSLAVKFPMDGFMEPNTQYYFSLRAIRNRGTLVDGVQTPPPSRWITVPVTTPLVRAPELFEVVRDLEIGFTVQATQPKGDPSNFEVYMKKTAESDSSYLKLPRDRYTLVRNPATNAYHWRVLGLQSDTWYDFRLRYIPPESKWYDADSATWIATPGTPLTRKTRDALHEIEVRWEGEDAYAYFLEARTGSEVDYARLTYSAAGVSDYGFEDADGVRTEFYQDRTNAQVRETPGRYMVYARISRKQTLQRDGTLQHVPLSTNSTYYIRLWARNPAVAVVTEEDAVKADSLHVGPVSTRTDFSQTDYDQAKDKENILSLYDAQSEELNRKPYWMVDKSANNAVRVLLKGDRVQAMLESDPGNTQTILLDQENDNAALYEVTIPEQVLEALHRVDGRLALRIGGAEYLISRSSFSLPALRAQVASSQVKETMLRIRITRRDAPDVAIPSLYSRVSKVYAFSVEAVGSRYARGAIETLIGDILDNPLATGPFRYGIVDRERNLLETNASAYTYRVHTDLLDTVGGMVGQVEGEMSRYLKDILDGGSGVPPFSMQKAAVSSFPGAILARLNYTYVNGRIMPLILPAGTTSWKEPSGMRAYTDSQAAFRLDGPAWMVMGSSKGVQGASALTWPGLTAISGKYDLSYAFGTKPVYPASPLTGQEAVLLFELIAEKKAEAQGMTMTQKLALLGLGDVIQSRTLLLPVDNQRAVSWSVRLYTGGLGKTVEQIGLVRAPAIANLSDVLPKLQKPVVLGLDMGLAGLDARKRFDVKGTASVGTLLEMAQKVLTLLGK